MDGHDQAVMALLTHQANKDLQNSQRQTALDLADEKGHQQVVNILLSRPA
jgi:ankyrin repeat protein